VNPFAGRRSDLKNLPKCAELGLEVSDETKAIFQRYVNGELTIKQLSAAIDYYLNLKTRSGPT
jgi:hypothetical protein